MTISFISIRDNETKETVFNVENIGNLGNSDHALIKLELQVRPNINNSKQLIHDWKRGDKEGLKEHLESINFGSEFQNLITNETWLRFKKVLLDVITVNP